MPECRQETPREVADDDLRYLLPGCPVSLLCILHFAVHQAQARSAIFRICSFHHEIPQVQKLREEADE